ncbi:MAG: IS91 family transposase, partial [Candidatus Thermoplasmatota archaeon]
TIRSNADPTRRSRLELADIVRALLRPAGYGGQAGVDRLGPLSSVQAQALRAIADCRTAALGGHVLKCEECGHRENSYNSCRNRHCPKCGGLEKARWLAARRADLLPVEYHHVVFTIPEELHPIFLAHAKFAIDALFAAVSETLQEVALNPKRLGARIGFTAVLHTWTQTLLFHPHVHCIVPGGGPSPTGDLWISAKRGFFLPVKILSTVFRGKLLSKLEAATGRGKLPKTAIELLVQASRKKWVVYSKPPVAGPEQVLDYLGRYTHRVAISNDRLVSLEDGCVTFRWKDRARGNQQKLLALPIAEFLRRFLLHVLPRGLMRIRHYGFLANAVRRRKVARCRELLSVPNAKDGADREETPQTWQEELFRLTGRDVTVCPKCHAGRLLEEEILPRSRRFQIPGRSTSP